MEGNSSVGTTSDTLQGEENLSLESKFVCKVKQLSVCSFKLWKKAFGSCMVQW